MVQAGMGVQGFLTSIYSRALCGPMGNFVRPFILGTVLGGGVYACSSQNPFPDGTIPGLPGEDGGLNDIGPQGQFDQCMPPNQSLMLFVEGRGAVFGNPPTMPADGSLAISINRQSIRYPGTGGDGGAGGDGGGSPDASVSADGLVHFTATGEWASMRTPTAAQPITGVEAGRIANRAGGDPISQLLRPNPSGIGNIRWSDQFAIFANPDPMVNDSNHDGINDKEQLGFLWPIEGTVNPTNCQVHMTFRTRARRLGVPGPALNYFVFPQYSDGRMDLDGSDEVVTIHQGALRTPDSNPFVLPATPDADGRRRSQLITLCVGTCDDVGDAASNPQEIRMRLVVEPRADAGTPEDAGVHADAHSDAPDGGIPPLPDGGDGGSGG